MPTEYARDNLGRYQTDGLSAKDFNKVFDLIRKQQRQNRRNARRTLTPRIMGMRNRELEAFLSLGKKKDGTYFTPEDIRSFNTSRQSHKTKFKSTVPGITYAQLVAQSTSITVSEFDLRNGIKPLRKLLKTVRKKPESLPISARAGYLSTVIVDAINTGIVIWPRLVTMLSRRQKSMHSPKSATLI